MAVTQVEFNRDLKNLRRRAAAVAKAEERPKPPEANARRATLLTNEEERQAIFEATMQMRALLYADMAEAVGLAKEALFEVIRSNRARNEVRVRAAGHIFALAMFLASSDKGLMPAAPDFDDVVLLKDMPRDE